jgi:hypothetical protein
VFSMDPPRDNLSSTEQNQIKTPCEDGLEYLHSSPASCRRRRKGNPVSGSITGPPCSWGDINTGTWPSRLGSLEFETVKYAMSPAELGSENDCAGEAQQQL